MLGLKLLWGEMDYRLRAEALSDEVIEMAFPVQRRIAHGSRGSVENATYRSQDRARTIPQVHTRCVKPRYTACCSNLFGRLQE